MWRAKVVIFLASSPSRQVLQVMTFVSRRDNADKLDNVTPRGRVIIRSVWKKQIHRTRKWLGGDKAVWTGIEWAWE